MRNHLLPLAILSLLALSGCEPDAGDILAIQGEGALGTQVYLDRNGDQAFTPSTDVPVPGVRLILWQGGDSIRSDTTNSNGVAVVTSIPVGRYRVTVDTTTFGDTLEVVTIDSATVSVGTTAPAIVHAALGYHSATLAEARALPDGELIAVRGVAMNQNNVFGDSTVHLADSTGVLRAARLQPGIPIVTGDSLRLVGRTGTVRGARVILSPAVYRLGTGELPDPVEVTTAEAATAHSGALDATLVQVADARILDSSTTATGEVQLKVDDGSGILTVALARNAGIVSETPLIRGVQVTVTGILVPAATGTGWVLKPRASADVAAEVRELTVEEARQEPVGAYVSIRGIALMNSAAFADASLHVADATSAIRVVGIHSLFVTVGDSLRLSGVISVSGGQPVLSNPTSALLGRANPPTPVVLTADEAAKASGGRLDAALVQLRGVEVDSISLTTRGTFLYTSDASGTLIVSLDENLVTPPAVAEGDTLDVVGVLAPLGSGQPWILRPRSAADVQKR
jgi:hypothetical protein